MERKITTTFKKRVYRPLFLVETSFLDRKYLVPCSERTMEVVQNTYRKKPKRNTAKSLNFIQQKAKMKHRKKTKILISSERLFGYNVNGGDSYGFHL